MAKSKSFFGLRRGSTKSLTFSVLNGQQVTKDRVYGGKNPRSLAQMIQRMCLATSSAAYAQMKQIVDHSFEGISYGANTMAEFIKVNTKLIKADYNGAAGDFGFNPYGDRGLKVGAYQMSKGTATTLVQSIFAPTINNHSFGVSIAVSGTGDLTADQLLAALGLQVGEMATICFMYAKAGSASDWVFGFMRFTALAGGTDAVTTANLAEHLLVESTLSGVVAAVGSRTLNISAIVNDDDADITDVPYTVIHSVKSNGAWLRSTNFMALPVGTDVTPSAEDALATYPVGESYVLNGGDIE